MAVEELRGRDNDIKLAAVLVRNMANRRDLHVAEGDGRVRSEGERNGQERGKEAVSVCARTLCMYTARCAGEEARAEAQGDAPPRT